MLGRFYERMSVKSSPRSADPEAASGLWERSVDLNGARLPTN